MIKLNNTDYQFVQNIEYYLLEREEDSAIRVVKAFKYVMIKICFILLFCLMGHIGWAQNPPLWRYWTQNEGLADTFCSTVTIAANGNIWINHGQAKKISIYDGYSFQHIEMPEILVPVHQSSSGNAWSIFWEEQWRSIGGFIRWKENQWKRFPHLDAKELLPYTNGLSLYETSNQELIYLAGDGLYRFSPDTNETTNILPASETPFNYFSKFAKQNDQLWVIGDEGIGKLRLDDSGLPILDSWSTSLIPDKYPIESLQFPYWIDDQSLMLTGKEANQDVFHVFQVNHNNWDHLDAFSADQVIAVPRNDSSYWLIKDPDVAFDTTLIQPNRTNTVETNKILSGRIWGITNDPQNNLWITTAQGLACNLVPCWQVPDEVAHIQEYCHSIHEDSDGRIWFGCRNYLLSFYEDNWNIIPLPMPANRYQSDSVCSLPDGRIVIKLADHLENQLLVYDPIKQDFEIYNHPDGFDIVLISPRKAGGVWMISQDGDDYRLDSYDGKKISKIAQINNLGLGETIYHLEETDDGSLWISGYDLSAIGRFKDGIYKRFDEADGYPGECMFSILDLGDGIVWFGARDRIIQYDGKTFSTVKDQFERIRCMTVDHDGSVWVASLSGIDRYYNGSWVNINHEEGFPNAAAIAVFADSKNRLWAGTTNSLCYYDKSIDQDPPETWLPSDKNNHEFLYGEKINFMLDGVDRWNHTSKDRLLFSYKINQGEWMAYQTNKLISHTESVLEPGNHTLHVRAMDRNWNVDATPVVYHFSVNPLWYYNPFLIVVIVVLLASIIISIILHFKNFYNVQHLVEQRTAMLKKRNEQLAAYQKQLQAMTSELSMAEERERQSLATQLHDSLSQSLALSIMELSMVPSSTEREQKSLQNIQERLDHVLQETKSLNFDLCPPVLYSLGLTAAIKQAGEMLCEQVGMQLQFFETGKQTVSDELRYFLFRATRELMFNTIKHAQANKLFIAVIQKQTMIKIIVHDNGVGIDQSKTDLANPNSSFGLFSIQERLKYLGGVFKIYTKLNRGSTFCIQLPLSGDNNYEN